jgi:hypothetical protein
MNMGTTREAICRDCGETFFVRRGGGIFFHLLRCDACGETTPVNVDELGDLYIRYVKGQLAPYGWVSAGYEPYVRERVPVDSISAEEYWAGVEAAVGACDCGGRFTIAAPPRCPVCRSTHIDDGPTTIHYD